jgi:uncharacterized protein (DUF2236 family)
VTGLRDIGDQGVLIGAGGYAILMQLADPAVAAGVARHSDFVNRPTDRLVSTLTFVYATLYGTGAQRSAVTRSVNRAHAPVRARAEDVASEAGAAGSYSAFDPQLQLWVAGTLCDAGVRMHELVYGPLSAEDGDRVFRDYEVLGTALQVPLGAWPGGRAAFDAWWGSRLPQLVVGPEAVAVAQQIFHPQRAPLWLRVALPTARLVTAGLLPDELRVAYGFAWSAPRQRKFDRLVRRVRWWWPRLPARLRTLPMRRLLARLSV